MNKLASAGTWPPKRTSRKERGYRFLRRALESYQIPRGCPRETPWLSPLVQLQRQEILDSVEHLRDPMGTKSPPTRSSPHRGPACNHDRCLSRERVPVHRDTRP